MDKYRTLAANTALISIGTFASKFIRRIFRRLITGLQTLLLRRRIC